MEPDKLMTGISEEMSIALISMSKASTPEEKLIHSKIVKNLSESLSVFLNMMNEMAFMEGHDDEDLF